MTIDRVVFAFAGTLVLGGTLLGHFVHPGFLVLPAFAGANMLQAAFTKACPLAFVLKRAGVKPGAAFG